MTATAVKSNEVKFFAAPKPFSNLQVKKVFAPGATIEEMINSIVPEKIRKAQVTCTIQINGHRIEQNQWHLVRPKAGTVVNLNVIPRGGKGKKNPLSTILSIALIVAAPYISPYIGVAAFEAGLVGSIGTGLLVGKIATFAIGQLLISALAPPPKPRDSGNASNPAESPTQFIEGATNQLAKYGVVPICLGTNRMFPNQAAYPYTESVNDEQFVRQLFTYGWGEEILIDKQKIGETVISEFNEIDIEHRLAGNLHLPTAIFSNDAAQDEYNVLLEESAGYTLRTTRANVDEAIVDVTLPRGLVQYNSKGQKIKVNVKLEVQYAPTGTSNWSPAVGSFKALPLTNISVQDVVTRNNTTLIGGQWYYVGYRKDIVVLDRNSGISSIIQGTGSYATGADTVEPSIPTTSIRLSTLVVKSIQSQGFPGTITTSVESYTDDRPANLFGTIIEESDDFKVTVSGTTATVAAGGLSTSGFDLNEARTEAIRRSMRIVFPSNGTYDIRIKRISPDTNNDQLFDKVYLSAIKSFIYRSPVKLQGINGTGIRIKGTDQLNGSIDQYNVVASNVILDYVPERDVWEKRVTSNPASIYRYVLQCAANAKALPDIGIHLEQLQDWHIYCTQQGYTYNRVIDYKTSLDEVLRDIASAGAASPAIVDNKRSVVIDRIKDDVVQIVTPRNSWNYNGKIIYPEIPHAFRVRFRNAEKNYLEDERIVYADGYNENNATLFEVLDLQSCTSASLAYKTARRHLATIILRPETHTFMMDVENLSMQRGDRIKLISDIIKVGIGQGRITEISLNDDSDMVTGISFDDTVSIPTNGFYFVRIRYKDGTFLYKEIVAPVGQHKSFQFVTPFSIADTPEVGDLAYFVEAGKELDLIITKIEPGKDYTARITALDYAPAIFDAENSAIPGFVSNVTTPIEFIRPAPPILLGEPQSDESVMSRNSDGSYLSKMVINLQNPNEGAVTPVVKIRRTGTDLFTNPNMLEASPERVVITGLEDGMRYDVNIRYMRSGSSTYSPPLTINNYKFIGASGIPNDVEDFTITVVQGTAIFGWKNSTNIDHHHFEMRFTSAMENATWTNAQVLEREIHTNRYSTALQAGTYLIKDFDILGNESANAKLIVTSSLGVQKNVVEVLDEHPTFAGVKDNISKIGNAIALSDASQIGYYYFAEDIDLDDVYTSKLTANVRAFGAFTNNIFVDDIFALPDVFGGGANDIIAEPDIFNVGDIFGIGEGKWSVTLECRTTLVNPALNEWSDWREFIAGDMEFRAIQFRIKLESFESNITPKVNILSVSIDMPDRIERGNDIPLPVEGYYVDYGPEFRSDPAVTPFVQDLLETDIIETSLKTTAGFFIRIYNTATNQYVARTFDYIVSGYGRKVV